MPSVRSTLVSALTIAVVAMTGVASASTDQPSSDSGQSSSHSSSSSASPNNNGNGNSGSSQGKAGSGSSSSDSTPSGSSSSDTASSHSTDGTAGTSGDPSQPQPTSNADQNSGGANGQCPGGPYCSTRDGSPSGNGNGNGQATGKPCAGCVGKADNKNPQGQMPNGSDHNAGYECDRNHGIGRSNPAHTGCTTTSTGGNGGGSDCTETPTAPECVGTDCTTNPTAEGCQQGGTDCTETPTAPECVGSDCTTNPTAEGCQQGGPDCTTNPPAAGCVNVLGEKHTRTPSSSNSGLPRVLGTGVVRTLTGLPFTGFNVATFVSVAGIALLAGLILQGGPGRRRRAFAESPVPHATGDWDE